MKKVKILHVLREMELGGIQSLIMNIYKNIDKEKVQFDFLVNSKGFYDKEITELGGNLYYMPHINQIGPLQYSKKLKNFLKEHREYKIIHTHFSHLSGLIVKIAYKSKIPVIIAHGHTNSIYDKGIRKIYKNHLRKNISKYATDFLACSKAAADYLFGNKSNYAVILKNGIEIEKYKFNNNIRKEVRKELNIENNCIVIGHIGRMDKIKNQIFLIKLIQVFLTQNINCKLLLIGDGPLKKEIEFEIEKNNLNSCVLLLGGKNDVEKYYNAMDYFVFPSLYEGLGISLIEAQANGLPCFASTNVPREANITNEVKYLSLNDSPEHWANMILNCPKKRYNKSAEIIKKGYDIKTVAKYLEKFYLEKNKIYEEDNK